MNCVGKEILSMLIQLNLDIFSKFGLLGCFNSIIGSYDTLLVYLDFMKDV